MARELKKPFTIGKSYPGKRIKFDTCEMTMEIGEGSSKAAWDFAAVILHRR